MFKMIKKFLQNRKIQFDIIFGFSLIILITLASVMYTTFSSHSSNLERISDRLMTETQNSIIQRTSSFMNEVKTSAELSAHIVSSNEDINITNENLIQYMLGVLKNNEQITSIYVGSEMGSFLQVARLSSSASFRAQPSEKLPGSYKYSVRFIDGSQPERKEYWQYRDRDGDARETETINNALFNHKIRQWYVSARQKRSFYWTDVYEFALYKILGITAAQPLYTGDGNSHEKGEFFGVIAADIQINNLDVFLKDSRIGKESDVMILDEDGKIVAYPESDKINEENKNSVIYVHDLPKEHLAKAFQHYLNTKKKNFKFEFKNKNYFAAFDPFPREFEKAWEVGVVVPEDVFLGEAKATTQRTMLLSLLIFVSSLVVIVLWSRSISRPIIKLTKEAIKIRNFDLDNGENINSNVYEIDRLNESIQSMRKSLQAFGKFVPTDVVRKLMSSKREVQIGGSQRDITIMFTDVVGFTTVSENYPPDKLMSHLSEYFDALTKVITKHNGTVDKYIGDAVMAFWGAPGHDKKHALHAATAALECQKVLEGLNRKWRSENKPELRTRIGLHSGVSIVGNLGASDRFNYTALGDAVNLAARLEAINKYYGTKIVVSESLQKIVNKFCVVQPLDIVAVKGKSIGVKIFELVGLKKGDPNLYPSKTKIEHVALFTTGFQVFHERRWGEAIKIFESIIDEYGKNDLASEYIERAKKYKKSPPAKNWTGITVMDKK